MNSARPPRMLMISPAAPWPATTGGLVRIAGIFEQMARHFDLTLVTPRRPDQRLPEDLPVRYNCPELPDTGVWRKGLALLDPSRPFHVAMYFRRQLAERIRRELAEHHYDVVYSHFLYGMIYLSGARVPVIVDQQNVDRVYWQNKARNSAFPLDALAAWNARKTMAFEHRVLPHIWAYVSVSDEDRDATRAYADPPVEHFWVASNGVDTRRFRPAETRPAASNVLTLGYLGSMLLQMNIDAVQRFCRDSLPSIRQALPDMDVRFVVIGSSPAPSIRALAAATPGMSLSGTVDDVVPWLQKLDILVCPLRIGAGTKLKVAEAMSCGLPVVGTALAFAGLPGRSGEHYVRTDTGEALVAAVSQLARSPAARSAMGSKARALAQAHLDWDAIGERLASDINGGLRERAHALRSTQ